MFTKEQVELVYANNTMEDLERYLPKTQVVEMFRVLYGIEPRNSLSKNELLYRVREFIEDEKRTKDLTKLLNVGRSIESNNHDNDLTKISNILSSAGVEYYPKRDTKPTYVNLLEDLTGCHVCTIEVMNWDSDFEKLYLLYI